MHEEPKIGDCSIGVELNSGLDWGMGDAIKARAFWVCVGS